MDDGGPAFPGTYTSVSGIPVWKEGMTLRDYFAAAALAGIMANSPRPDTAEEAALAAYEAADAMLKARQEGK